MPHVLRALPSIARVAVAGHVAYRAEMTIWILTTLLPLIMLAIWSALATDGPVAGFGETELARYFVAVLIARQLTGAWVVWELNWEIRTGKLSSQLLRPFHPLANYAIWMITALPFRLAVLTPLVALLVWWRPDLAVLPSPLALAAFCVSIAMAWTLNFLIQSAFGCLSFWVDKSDGLFGVWFSVWALLSGYIAPIALLPDWVAGATYWLPFRYTLALPAELLGGFRDPATVLPELALQAAWVGAAALVVRLLWARGLRRYGAFGA